MVLVVAVIGLGEAGSAIAEDLARLGVIVRGWDPARRTYPKDIVEASGSREAAKGSDVILSVNSARVATAVASEVAGIIGSGQLFADLNTTSPSVKREVASVIEPTGAMFADVALMAPVADRGIKTPALVSGPGAEQFRARLSVLGMPIDVVSERVGAAAELKLLRSIFMKGWAAAVIESLDAAVALGRGDWLRSEIARELREANADLITRFVEGSRRHAGRRIDEMESAAEMMRSLGLQPRITTATKSLLQTYL